MANPEQFNVLSETHDSTIILRPQGEVDLNCAPALREHICDVQQHKPEKLIIDLADVPYMDSSGVATLVEAMQTARRSGGQLILCCMQAKVMSIFEIARLDTVFTIVPDKETAMQ